MLLFWLCYSFFMTAAINWQRSFKFFNSLEHVEVFKLLEVVVYEVNHFLVI